MEKNQYNTLILIRDQVSDKQIIGKLLVKDEFNAILFTCFTLELPWQGNQRNISCIPAGIYKAKKRKSETFGRHFHILDVPNRDYILIHEANHVHELRGCIAVGDQVLDIDGDQLPDVLNSIKTKNKLLGLLPDSFQIIISS
ncbi:hypothetical protein GCM10027284_09250 [Cyclobacterium sediminis]